MIIKQMLAFIFVVLSVALSQNLTSFDFDHPQVPTIFYWGIRVDSLQCVSDCQINLTNKKTEEKANFTINTPYLSCDYLDDYIWNINCADQYCKKYYTTKDEIYTYPQTTLFATKIVQEEGEKYMGLVVIRIPQC